MKKQNQYLILLIVFITIAIIINTPYRHFVYTHGIKDFGLADSGSKLFIVSIFSLMSWIGLFKLSQNKVLDIFIVSSAYVVLEFLSYFIPYLGVFDYRDLIALFFGITIALLIVFYSDRKSFSDFSKILADKIGSQ